MITVEALEYNPCYFEDCKEPARFAVKDSHPDAVLEHVAACVDHLAVILEDWTGVA